MTMKMARKLKEGYILFADGIDDADGTARWPDKANDGRGPNRRVVPGEAQRDRRREWK